MRPLYLKTGMNMNMKLETDINFANICLQIPELDFEIPPEAQRGSLSTVSLSYLNHLDMKLWSFHLLENRLNY